MMNGRHRSAQKSSSPMMVLMVLSSIAITTNTKKIMSRKSYSLSLLRYLWCKYFWTLKIARQRIFILISKVGLTKGMLE